MNWWYNRTVRAAGIAGLLALCGLAILVIVRAETGTEGFVIGLFLAIVPVPLLISGFRWLDKVEPTPWRSLGFAFAWGACTATLVAVVANTFATEWLTTTVITSPGTDADFVGAVLVAPITEEIAKVTAILLLFLHRPRNFTGPLAGIVIAGFVATGFAFTENILYLGSAYGEDQELGGSGVPTTAMTFVVRVLMSPFAHPLFTIMAGIAFGFAATLPAHRRVMRTLLPFLGLLGAIGLHALWNGTASVNGFYFLASYALLMAPLCGGLIWLAIWQRNKLLRTVRTVLAHYAAQGWLTQHEAYGIGSMKLRWAARDLARRERGTDAARTVTDYHQTATALGLLRSRAARIAPEEFTAREGELLSRLLTLRPLGSPYTTRASQPRYPLYYAPYYPPPHGYAPQGHAPHGYAPQGHAPQGHAPQATRYAPQGYAPHAAPYTPHSLAAQPYPSPTYPAPPVQPQPPGHAPPPAQPGYAAPPFPPPQPGYAPAAHPQPPEHAPRLAPADSPQPEQPQPQPRPRPRPPEHH